MQKLALAALAAALVSVMAISAGPANAQRWNNDMPATNVAPYTGNTWGMMRNPAQNDRYVNSAAEVHAFRCDVRYQTYNADTDMFLGNDGRYHRCNL